MITSSSSSSLGGAGPEISVLMPCRNAMPWLPSTVASILRQEAVCLELIVVDDCSLDGSLEFLQELERRLKEVRQKEGASGHTGREEQIAATTQQDFVGTRNSPAGGQDDGEQGVQDEDAAPRPHADLNTRWWPTTSEAGEVERLSVEDVVAAVTTSSHTNSPSRRTCACSPSRRTCACSPHTLRVFALPAHLRRGPSGQGAALNFALSLAKAPLIGEMESDDLRPRNCFAKLKAGLDAHPDWDCVTSRVLLMGECCGAGGAGAERRKSFGNGMSEFALWQNSLLEPEELARDRFIEIPAMRASGLFRREVLIEKIGGYRDLWPVGAGGAGQEFLQESPNDPVSGATSFRGTRIEDFAALVAPHVDDAAGLFSGLLSSKEKRPLPPSYWPVDSDFWMTFFHKNLKAGKLPSELYHWRQYSHQSTRTHSRCSQENLRDCKAYYFSRLIAEAVRRKKAFTRLQIWTGGKTLGWWESRLRCFGVTEFGEVECVDWVPVETVETKPAVETARQRKREEGEGCWRLFVFGSAKAREKVVRIFGAANLGLGETDWFAA